MPRPSDVYATFGAPGVYQATSCTPTRLPNVYLFPPPEEDSQDVYCLFHSGSALPATFESFYCHPAYTQRDPASPTLTDQRTLDHTLSYFQRQSTSRDSARYGPGRSWEHEEQIQKASRNYPRSTASSASSRSSLSESLRGSSEIEAETSVYSNARHLGEAEGQPQEQWQYQSKSPSRRSTIFADRSPEYEAFKTCVIEDPSASRKTQTMSFRNRAAMAFKGLGNVMTRRQDAHVTPEHKCLNDEPAIHDSWIESPPLPKKRSRRTLPLNSHVDTPSLIGDVDLGAPTHPSSSVRDHKLAKRKSMTQLFGQSRASMESGTATNSVYPRPDMRHPAARSSSSLLSFASESKLSKRKSMTQLLGLGRSSNSIGLSDHTTVAVEADETWSDTSGAPRVAAPQALDRSYSSFKANRDQTMEHDSKASQISASPATLGPTAQRGRRKSFLSRHGFPFLDLHRHFVSDNGPHPSPQLEHAPPAAPAIDPSVSFSPDSLSEGTDSSSSVAASTDCERTTEDDMHFPVSHMSTIMGHGRVALAREFEPSMLSRSQLDLNKDIEGVSLSPRFSFETPDDVESETGEDPPTLELAVRLDSLTFDQLVFDPESFTGSVYD